MLQKLQCCTPMSDLRTSLDKDPSNSDLAGRRQKQSRKRGVTQAAQRLAGGKKRVARIAEVCIVLFRHKI